MKLISRKSDLRGEIDIPASKSHTIRGVYLGCLAEGESALVKPLDSLDTKAAVSCARSFGAVVEKGENWIVKGVGAGAKVPDNVIDTLNSGTSTNFFMALAATLDGYTVLTGDEQIRRRPVQSLIDSLNDLGAKVFSTRNNGFPPVVIKGRIKGGRTIVDGRTSIYTSALLFSCPLAEGDSELIIKDPKEIPYVEMTLAWLDKQGIKYQREGSTRYLIPGGQKFVPFKERIPADFSTATFFLCGAALNDSQVTLRGLDMNDTQGDKQVVEYLREMGTRITDGPQGLTVRGGGLKGTELDMGDTPDALPAMAVTACFAEGETKIRNILSARWKETDRIAVMAQELSKLGAGMEELKDGLIIRPAKLKSAPVSGHLDHRVVMALSLAGLGLKDGLEIDTAEALNVTVPGFVGLMRALGADLEMVE